MGGDFGGPPCRMSTGRPAGWPLGAVTRFEFLLRVLAGRLAGRGPAGWPAGGRPVRFIIKALYIGERSARAAGSRGLLCGGADTARKYRVGMRTAKLRARGGARKPRSARGRRQELSESSVADRESRHDRRLGGGAREGVKNGMRGGVDGKGKRRVAVGVDGEWRSGERRGGENSAPATLP